MLRALALAKRGMLIPKAVPVGSLTAEAASFGSTAIYDVQRSKRAAEHQRPIPLVAATPVLTNLRWTSGVRSSHVAFPDPSVVVCDMMNMLKCVDLTHMKDAPPSSFWVSMVVGGTQVVIPLLELLGGYSATLTLFQLHLAVVAVAALGGVKWGLATSSNPVPSPSWDTMVQAGAPPCVALLGLALPYPLGFLSVAAAVVSSLYLDLKSNAFPPWGNAIRLFVALTTVAGLTMALIAYILFDNTGIDKNKEKEKKDSAKSGAAEGNNEEKESKQ